MEMSRQRLRPALSEGASIPCPRCGGHGHIRDTESSALQILRIIQEESMKDSTAAVHVQVPVEVASFLLNEKRTEIAKIELKQRINVLMVPNKTLETPNYRLERLKHDDARLDNLRGQLPHGRGDRGPDHRHAPLARARQQAGAGDQGRAARRAGADRGAQARARARPSRSRRAPAAKAPAPAATPVVAETGFTAWIKGLFGIAPAAAPAPAPVVAQPKKEERREGRGEGRGEATGRSRRRPR